MKLSKQLVTVTPFSKYLAMILFIVFPFIGFYLGIQYARMSPQQSQPVIASFVDCKNAGYPVLYSYPAQCRTPDGRVFREIISSTPTPEITKQPTSCSDCPASNETFWQFCRNKDTNETSCSDERMGMNQPSNISCISCPRVTPSSTTPTPTCIPRPRCLDYPPYCMMPETSNMCPKKTPVYHGGPCDDQTYYQSHLSECSVQ